MDEQAKSEGTVLQGGRRNSAAKLGELVSHLFEEQIAPRQTMLNRVSDAWGRLLPEQLGQHSRIAGLLGGQLKVLADSPAYVYELTLCSAELVGELQRMVPAARIQKIKVTLG